MMGVLDAQTASVELDEVIEFLRERPHFQQYEAILYGLSNRLRDEAIAEYNTIGASSLVGELRGYYIDEQLW